MRPGRPRPSAQAILQSSACGSQTERSRPTSRMRCSATRSAATDGRHTFALGVLEHAERRVVDLRCPHLGAVEVEALELVGDLHQSAGVDAVVGRVRDAVLLEQLVDAFMSELVVGRTADDLGRQHADDLVVERATERARRVDVERFAYERRRVGDDTDRRVGLLERLDGRGVDVGDDDVGVLLEQESDEVAADLADTGDADGLAGRATGRPTRGTRWRACPGRRRRR